jgi:hypothetical protein
VAGCCGGTDKEEGSDRAWGSRQPDKAKCASSGAMNCLSFNCRGAGNKPTVRELSVISHVWSPRLFFLCETRQSTNKMRRFCHRLGLKGFAGFGTDGRSGGLALFWHESLFCRSPRYK